jgi:hypothetical protein
LGGRREGRGGRVEDGGRRMMGILWSGRNE